MGPQVHSLSHCWDSSVASTCAGHSHCDCMHVSCADHSHCDCMHASVRGAAVPGRHCLLGLMHSLWLLHSFYVFSHVLPWAPRGGIEENITFRTKYSTACQSVHIAQLWVPVMSPPTAERNSSGWGICGYSQGHQESFHSYATLANISPKFSLGRWAIQSQVLSCFNSVDLAVLVTPIKFVPRAPGCLAGWSLLWITGPVAGGGWWLAFFSGSL